MSASSSRRLKGPSPAASAWASSAGKDSEGELGARLGFGFVGIGSLLGLGGTMKQVPPQGGRSLGHFYL
jgi:hypothetical protein